MAKQTRTMTIEQMLEMRERGATYAEIAKAANISNDRALVLCKRGLAKASRGRDRVARVVAR